MGIDPNKLDHNKAIQRIVAALKSPYGPVFDAKGKLDRTEADESVDVEEGFVIYHITEGLTGEPYAEVEYHYPEECIHSDDGPAVKYADGTVEYWKHGKKVDSPES